MRAGVARAEGHDRDVWNPIDKAWSRVHPHVACASLDRMLDGDYDVEVTKLTTRS